MKYLLILVAVALAALIGLSFMSSRTPDNIGPVDGRLHDCPDTDNCVASTATDPKKRVETIQLDGPEEEVMDRLARAVAAMDHSEVAETDGNYLRAVFTSPLWRFRDDLELLYDRQAGVVHVRSASRVGYSDFGANRKRVEALRAQLQQQ